MSKNNRIMCELEKSYIFYFFQQNWFLFCFIDYEIYLVNMYEFLSTFLSKFPVNVSMLQF